MMSFTITHSAQEDGCIDINSYEDMMEQQKKSARYVKIDKSSRIQYPIENTLTTISGNLYSQAV
jgi:hypothetical protein